MGRISSFAGGESRTKSWGGGWWCCGLGAGGLCFCWRVCFFRVAVVLLPFLLLGVVAACAGALGLLAPFRAAFLSGARRLRVLCSFRGASWAARLRFFLARLRFFWRALWAGRLRFLWAGGAGGWLRFFLGRAAGGAAAFFLAGRCVSVFFCSGGAPALFSGVRRWRCVCVFFWRVSRAVCLRFLSWRVVRLGFFLARAAGGAPAFFLGGRRACFFFWAGGAAAFFSGARRGRRGCVFFWRAPRRCVCVFSGRAVRRRFSGRAARLFFFLARAAGVASAFFSGACRGLCVCDFFLVGLRVCVSSGARRAWRCCSFLGGRCVCVFFWAGGAPAFFSGARRGRRACVFFWRAPRRCVCVFSGWAVRLRFSGRAACLVFFWRAPPAARLRFFLWWAAGGRSFLGRAGA